VVSAVEAIGRLGDEVPSEEAVRRFAAEAAKSVPEAVPGGVQEAPQVNAAPGALATASGRGRTRRLSPALVTAAAAVVVLMFASAGVAYAANGAVPGDTLYGLDLALEKIGVGAGGLTERLTEASELVAIGRAQQGLDLAGKAISESATGDEALHAAAEALRSAAETALGSQSLGSPEELGEIAEKLRSMASGDKSAEELGRAVEDLTGTLGEDSAPGGSDSPGGPDNDPGQGKGGAGETDSGSDAGQSDIDSSATASAGADGSSGGDGQPH